MTPFLQQVAKLFYQRYGTDIQQMAFVFPNRRSGLFFRKYLSQASGKPLFSPAIVTIEGLFFQLSGKQQADPLRMLFLLYEIYIRQSGSTESFDDFAHWGEILLKDFNDIDKYLADPRRLFTNITDLHEMEKKFDYLQPQQIEAIRSFWSSFKPDRTDPNQQRFLDIWTLLYPVYQELKETLAAEGVGYEGMIFREVVEKIKQDGRCDLPYTQVVFVGLNVLSAAEKELLLLFRKQGIADFYWDCGSEKLMDANNKASFFIREHLKTFPSKWPLPPEEPVEQEIELIGTPSHIGQAKQVHALLETMLGSQNEIQAEEALRTAIVLPDEQLLIPVLNSIPEAITRINVTLGFPLSGTPVSSLMELIPALHHHIRNVNGEDCFYYRETLSVLNHRYISTIYPDVATAIINEITTNNRIYVPAQALKQTPLLSLIFTPIEYAKDLPDYLIAILQELNKAISALQPEKDEDETVCMDEFEQEFIFHYFKTLNRIKELIRSANIRMSAETFFRLLKQITGAITIPFRGEPLSGLQVMGVLETRVLDFDRLIILSVNEGVFPAKSTANTFIPHNLRYGFGLPTYEHQDSIWAYHFYRLIARAKKIVFLYDTRTDGVQTGEVSRFVHQLKYHYEMPVKEKLAVYQVAHSQPLPLKIEKTDEVMKQINHYLKGGEKALSASLMNTYIDCPLKFYLSAIEGLKEEEEVTDDVENKLFGSILHKVIEQLYQPCCGAQVTADLLKLAAQETTLTNAIQTAFAELLFHTKEIRPLSGKTYLTGEMIRKYALQILSFDRKLTPFRYLQSEKKIQCLFTLSDGREVQLKGFIDRMDEVQGAVRIVDYKTGTKKDLKFQTMESLFDSMNEKRQSAIMQVFTYAWMIEGTVGALPVQPVVYYVRDLFSDGFDPAIYRGKEKEMIRDFYACRNEFEACLRTCLDELFDPNLPFQQTFSRKPCQYCPFANVCGRLP